MKKIICPNCGGLLGFKFEKGDPGYIDTEEIDTIRLEVDGEVISETSVDELKEQMASMVSNCPHCGALVQPYKNSFTFTG